MPRDPWCHRAKRVLLGAPRDLFDPKIFHHVSLIAFFAWVGLGADGISSSSYGPEEAYLALGGHTVLALFVGAATVLTVFIISASYSQIIEAFPSGGGAGTSWRRSFSGRRRASFPDPPWSSTTS